MKLVVFLLVIFSGQLLAQEKLCRTVVIHEKDIDFTDTERRMLCGDSSQEGYRVIPAYEAKVFMTGFLQSRGRLHPEFEIKDDVLHVWPRGKTKIHGIVVVTGEEKERKKIKDEVQRRFRKKVLTPKTMDALEAGGLSVIRRRGYPCAKVESEALVPEHSVTLHYSRLVWHPFGPITRQEIKGLHPNALTRFYPMEKDDQFDELLLQLTEKRMIREQVVAGTYFLENCSEDAKTFSLSQEFILGPPRSFRYGVGANTEVGPFARAQWAHNRFRPMASKLSATLQASLRVQALNLTADMFVWPNRPRTSIFGQFDLIRESQFDYLQTTARLRPHMKWTEDKLGRGWTYTLGPTFEAGQFKSEEKIESRSYKTAAAEGRLMWNSHVYEFFDQHPQEGDTFAFGFDYRDPSFGFTDKLLKLDSTFARLGQVGVWERGELIAGLRLNGGTTFVPTTTELENLPPSVKFYGGGSDDLRGFLLRTLPKNDGLGALTKFGGKLELRRTSLLLDSLEGFIFLDGARFGDRSWELEKRVWYSPGVGLRWHSPIGMVQGYVARARATKPTEDFGNFYFVGLGGSF